MANSQKFIGWLKFIGKWLIIVCLVAFFIWFCYYIYKLIFVAEPKKFLAPSMTCLNSLSSVNTDLQTSTQINISSADIFNLYNISQDVKISSFAKLITVTVLLNISYIQSWNWENDPAISR